MSSVVIFSPAKINLFLAITEKRPDGFHNLVSVAAPLTFGDTLWVSEAVEGKFSIQCDDPRVPLDESNTVLRAAYAYRKATGWDHGAQFVLTKSIPMGAGLGGGSSNAAAALIGMNRLAGHLLSIEQLERISAGIGSDCPLFFRRGPVILRGRGERLEDLPTEVAKRLSGRRLLLFKPSISIATAWAYGRMSAAAPAWYLPEAQAESALGKWMRDSNASAAGLLFNNMENAAFAKYLTLPTLLEALRTEFELAVGMSGSGSACFALLAEEFAVDRLIARIQSTWGADAFLKETRIR